MTQPVNGNWTVVVDNLDERIRFLDPHGVKQRTQSTVCPSVCYRRAASTMGIENDTASVRLEFNFTGSSVKVHGFPREINRDNRVNCTIEPNDGIKTEATVRYDRNGSFSDVLCDYGGLSSTVTYHLGLAAFSKIFVDYIEYTTDKPSEGDTVRFNHKSSSITYSENVTITDEFAVLDHGQGFNFTYYGDTATPYFYVPEDAHTSESAYFEAKYDFSPTAQSYKLSNSPEPDGGYFPLQMDSNYPYKIGHHWIHVRYTDVQSPIYLNFIEVEYKPPLSSSSSDIPDLPTTPSSPTLRPRTSVGVQAIVGATIGSIVGALILSVCVLRCLRRRHRALRVEPDSFPQEGTPNSPFTSGKRRKRNRDEASQHSNRNESSGRVGWAVKQAQAFISFGLERNPEPAEHASSLQPRLIQVIHADSGMTLPEAQQGDVIEDIPPQYSARVRTNPTRSPVVPNE